MNTVVPRIILVALILFVSVQGSAVACNTSAQTLRAMIGHDHFAAELGGLYTGISDQTQRAELNAKVDAAAEALAGAATNKATAPRLLAILKEHLAGIDRDLLDTEDAEHVAGLFEQMLDALRIDSSEGILNDWMYGFNPV